MQASRVRGCFPCQASQVRGPRGYETNLWILVPIEHTSVWTLDLWTLCEVAVHCVRLDDAYGAAVYNLVKRIV
jgi:hypothetical protein